MANINNVNEKCYRMSDYVDIECGIRIYAVNRKTLVILRGFSCYEIPIHYTSKGTFLDIETGSFYSNLSASAILDRIAAGIYNPRFVRDLIECTE